jgi:hypothetical protein
VRDPERWGLRDEDRSTLAVEKTLPELLLLLSGERATGEPLDVADKEEETLRAGNEFIADEIEKEGMVGDWDRLDSRSILGSKISFSLSPCSDLMLSSMSFFSSPALLDISRLFSSTCSEDIFNILGITSLALAFALLRWSSAVLGRSNPTPMPTPLSNCLGGGGNEKASNSTEGDLTMVQSSSIDGGGWMGLMLVVEWLRLSSLGGIMWCWSLRLPLLSLALIMEVEVAVGIEFLGNGGSGIASSPREDVEERADWRLKNREEATSEEGEDERVVVLGRGPAGGWDGGEWGAEGDLVWRWAEVEGGVEGTSVVLYMLSKGFVRDDAKVEAETAFFNPLTIKEEWLCVQCWSFEISLGSSGTGGG